MTGSLSSKIRASASACPSIVCRIALALVPADDMTYLHLSESGERGHSRSSHQVRRGIGAGNGLWAYGFTLLDWRDVVLLGPGPSEANRAPAGNHRRELTSEPWKRIQCSRSLSSSPDHLAPVRAS